MLVVPTPARCPCRQVTLTLQVPEGDAGTISQRHATRPRTLVLADVSEVRAPRTPTVARHVDEGCVRAEILITCLPPPAPPTLGGDTCTARPPCGLAEDRAGKMPQTANAMSETPSDRA